MPIRTFTVKLLTAIWIVAASFGTTGCGGNTKLTEVQRGKSGNLEVVVLSPHDALKHGKDTFSIEFRRAGGTELVDVGNVRASASMSMSGVPMFGSVDVKPSGTAGRYEATADFSMAGTWRLQVVWSGGSAPAGSIVFSGNIQ